MKLHSQRLQTLEEIRAFLAGSTPLDFEVPSRGEAYEWIEASLRQLGYLRLGKAAQQLNQARAKLFRAINRAQTPGA